MADLRYGSLGRIAAVALIMTGGVTALACSSENQAVAQQGQPGTVRAGGQLASFKSDADFLAFLKKRRDSAQRRRLELPGISGADVAYSPAPAPPAAANETSAMKVGTAQASDRITNTQEADVDEGGIVKKRGDLLVILRRGRLFTVSIAGGQMRPIDHINAFPPGITGGGDWYDEMLISGDRVIVIGYSYARGGTEVNRFRLSPDGRLRFEDAYHLRSNDYYSSRNYASRLIGNRLVYYTPLFLGWGNDPFAGFPAVSRWQKDAKPLFRRVARARDVYIVPSHRDDEEAELDTLHSVMDCDLTAPVMDCKATAVLGPASRTFYVSPTAVYLWVSDARHWRAAERGRAQSWLYRLPLDGIEKPSAIGARGQPTDQFSFREDRRLGLIDVLVRSDGGGDWMWNNEESSGEVALLSVPVRSMGDGNGTAPRSRYRQLPPVGRDAWNFQNRFVNGHVLYGGHGYQGGQHSTLVAAALRGGPVAQLTLPHAVERLDQLVEDGVVIGNDPRGGLTFTAVDLRRPAARIGNSFTFPAAQQGENRSQAFFFRPDTADGSSGVLGLPITTQLESQYARFLGSGSSILFLRRENRLFDMAGRLDADPKGAADDACVASCVDWYGNARPIFIGNRVFALMGYELVEGRLARAGSIGEVARVNFAPPGRVRR
ncbi:MAG: beta-propeller domain-containing protein [Pseudomonadota bacterium]|nr:beta-propeller domain-containing protein [Pseudomonadota bacterium]